MNRSTTDALLAMILAGFGLYRAAHLPAMLVGPPTPLLVFGFALQAAAGLVAAVGVWQRAAWAALAVLVLSVAVAVTVLVEALVLGIVPWLPAVFEAVVAITLGLLLAAYLRGRIGPRAAAAGAH